jgi:hypothetical protein
MNTIADSSSNIVSTSVISCMRPTAAMDISVFSWVIIPGGAGGGGRADEWRKLVKRKASVKEGGAVGR